jgi:hypothetical protein
MAGQHVKFRYWYGIVGKVTNIQSEVSKMTVKQKETLKIILQIIEIKIRIALTYEYQNNKKLDK